jgi:hypothetical protein
MNAEPPLNSLSRLDSWKRRSRESRNLHTYNPLSFGGTIPGHLGNESLLACG